MIDGKSSDEKLQAVFERIDATNCKDPNNIQDRESERPAALVYGERMTDMLNIYDPSADDLLKIAVRAQHIERWTSPRNSYPEGRAGYLTWRSDLKTFHGRRAGELMQASGYSETDCERVAGLISKRGLKRDPQTQILEDVACLVFLKFYAGDFINDHDDDAVIRILGKTAKKMSPRGVAAAAGLDLSDRLGSLLTKTVEQIA